MADVDFSENTRRDLPHAAAGDLTSLEKQAQQGAGCDLRDALAANPKSFSEDVAILQAIADGSKNSTGLPQLELTFQAHKENASVTAGLLMKGTSMLDGGKLIYSETYNPAKQSIDTFCLRNSKK